MKSKDRKRVKSFILDFFVNSNERKVFEGENNQHLEQRGVGITQRISYSISATKFFLPDGERNMDKK